jgi:hypothetical protein
MPFASRCETRVWPCANSLILLELRGGCGARCQLGACSAARSIRAGSPSRAKRSGGASRPCLMPGWSFQWSTSSSSVGAPSRWARHFGGKRIGRSQTSRGESSPRFYSIRRRGGPGAADARAHSWASSDSGAVSHPGGIGDSRRRPDVDSKASHPPDGISPRRFRGTSSSST